MGKILTLSVELERMHNIFQECANESESLREQLNRLVNFTNLLKKLNIHKLVKLE